MYKESMFYKLPFGSFALSSRTDPHMVLRMQSAVVCFSCIGLWLTQWFLALDLHYAYFAYFARYLL